MFDIGRRGERKTRRGRRRRDGARSGRFDSFDRGIDRSHLANALHAVVQLLRAVLLRDVVARVIAPLLPLRPSFTLRSHIHVGCSSPRCSPPLAARNDFFSVHFDADELAGPVQCWGESICRAPAGVPHPGGIDRRRCRTPLRRAWDSTTMPSSPATPGASDRPLVRPLRVRDVRGELARKRDALTSSPSSNPSPSRRRGWSRA